MSKYLLLKHYRGGPPPVVDLATPDQWTPEEWDAHVRFMRDFATRLEETGEFVDTQGLAPDGAFVRYDGEGQSTIDSPTHCIELSSRKSVRTASGGAALVSIPSGATAGEIANPTSTPTAPTPFSSVLSSHGHGYIT